MGLFLAQLPALIGVVIGVLGTILATTTADRARWKRDQSVRWDERRLDAYREYARAIKEIHTTALRLTAGPASLSQPIERKEGLRLLEQANDNRTKIWETMLLLGDEATVSAAREWRYAVRQLEDLARKSTNEHDETVRWPLVDHANQARDNYYAIARKTLDIRGGSVEQAPWLQSAK